MMRRPPTSPLFPSTPLSRSPPRRDPPLLVAPAAQRRGRPCTEKLHLGAVLGEGVPGDEEAQHGLLPRQAIVLAPGGKVGKWGRRSGVRGVLPSSEQRMLTRLPLRLAGLRLRSRVVHGRDGLRAVAPEGIASAGGHQR